MSLPLHVMCNSLLLASRLLDLNNIDSVLPRCNDKRFSTNHSLTDSNSLLRISSISDTSLLEASSAESSAYKRSLHLTAAFISLTYIRNKRGPSIDPCGTPHVTDLNSEKTPEISTACTLPPKYEINQFTAAWLTPKDQGMALNMERKMKGRKLICDKYLFLKFKI